MNIRIANSKDCDAIDELLSVCYPTLMEGFYSSNILDIAIPLISKSRPELLVSGTFFIASMDNGIPIGCGGWTAYSPNDSINTDIKTGHIRHFATHPDFTNKGIGKSIFNACKEQARTHSIRRFECFSSLNAEGFYKSLGFTTSHPMEIELIKGLFFPCLLMKYTL